MLEFCEKHKGFILFVLVFSAFFMALFISDRLELSQVKRNYEEQIEELKKLVDVTNIGESKEVEMDIYQSASDFLRYYYGVSEVVSEEYRAEQLKQLMTESAYSEYMSDYNNRMNYTITLTDICIYVDYKNSNGQTVYACIFFDENIDWPNINTITLRKYWTGVFVPGEKQEEWKVDEITDCQELLTKEEFNALNADTNGSVLEDITLGGGESSADDTEAE